MEFLTDRYCDHRTTNQLLSRVFILPA